MEFLFLLSTQITIVQESSRKREAKRSIGEVLEVLPVLALFSTCLLLILPENTLVYAMFNGSLVIYYDYQR